MQKASIEWCNKSINFVGNCHAEDDNGRLFYLHGCVNERPTVDDNDLPIVESTIRREIPAISDAEFEKLDKLSGGKLRHLLVGSPSGYSWTDQTETILSFEYQKKLKEKIPIDSKMIPASKRPSLLEDSTDTNRLDEPEEPRKIKGASG